MARIVVLQHETTSPERSKISLRLLCAEWERNGHEVLFHSGTHDLPDGDLAVLHVNLSVVPAAYVDAARRYPRAVNAGAVDIRKRLVSRNVLAKGDDWNGPVIVKSDLNCGGLPEVVTAMLMARDGKKVETPHRNIHYTVHNSVQEVAEILWTNPNFIVERFLPEQDEKGFYLRTWIFFGPEEICRRFSGSAQIIKGGDYANPELVDVPEFLRSERERLGFDYGKFDFVIHDGEVILLDANKTPGIPPESRPGQRAAYANLAPGLDWFLG